MYALIDVCASALTQLAVAPLSICLANKERKVLTFNSRNGGIFVSRESERKERKKNVASVKKAKRNRGERHRLVTAIAAYCGHRLVFTKALKRETKAGGFCHSAPHATGNSSVEVLGKEDKGIVGLKMK